MSPVFHYSNPPVIHWGAGSVTAVAGELKRLDAWAVALVTSRSVATKGGAAGAVLAAPGGMPPVATILIGQHAPVTDIEAGIEAAAAARADAVLSVGGGSPIDAAKVIALRAGEQVHGRPLRHVAVPTTLSVAELASSAGFTDAAGDKVGLRDPRALPDAVVYDAELTLATPLDLWLSTGIRAVDHGVEGFLAEGEHPFEDTLAVEGLRRLFRSLPAAKERPGDASIRTENQLGAWFAYTLTGPTAAGLSHMMGKQIGARHGIPHGVTSCLLLPHVMRYRARLQPERAAKLAQAIGVGEDGAAAAGAVADLIERLGLPRRIRDFGLGEAELRAAAEGLTGPHSAADLLAIYRAAF
jgi:maleylacetate reductase